MHRTKEFQAFIGDAGSNTALREASLFHNWRTAAEGLRRWFRSLTVRNRPKISLLTGSVLLLMTVYLPVAYSQCGPNRTGREYLLGAGIWPGFLGSLLWPAGPALYFLSLVFACLTMCLVLAAQVRPALLRNRRLIKCLLAIAGTAYLFTVGDFFWLNLGTRIGHFLGEHLNAFGLNLMMVALAASAIVIMAYSLRSKFLRSQRWIVWLFIVASANCLFAIASYLLFMFHLCSVFWADLAFFLGISPSILYLAVPLGLWYRFGLSRRGERAAQWPAIRSGIILLYVPATLYDFVALAAEMRPGRMWGLLPFFVGVNLISLGYLGLMRQASSALGKQVIGGAEPDLAGPSEADAA